MKGYEPLVLLGLMLGFAIGVKFTSFILIVSTIAIIWNAYGDKWAGLGAILLGFFLVLLLQLDSFSGTRAWHSQVWITQWSMALGGLALMGYSFWKNRKTTLENLKRSVILGSFLLLTFSPWLIKNVSEADQLNTKALLSGKKAIPDFSQNKELQKLKIQARNQKQKQQQKKKQNQ